MEGVSPYLFFTVVLMLGKDIRNETMSSKPSLLAKWSGVSLFCREEQHIIRDETGQGILMETSQSYLGR